ncbi:MAG: sulfotransferase family protein [Pseudomonadota bacterium]
MSMKVIGAGFGRTGTLSLKTALERLGFDKTHHMMEVMRSRQQVALWAQLAAAEDGEAPAPAWDTVFEGFQATTDFPACVYWAELAEYYPDAKVVLTVRDADSWFNSIDNTIGRVVEAIPTWLKWLVPHVGRHATTVERIVWQKLFHGRQLEREYAKSVFEAHTAAVIERIPADRLLVYEVREGWEPLCRFLDVPVPDEPFPRVNDTASMQRSIRIMEALNWLPLVIAGAAAAIWLL